MLIGLTRDAHPYAPGPSILERPGIRLESFIDASDPAMACRRGVDYAIFHKDLQTEMARGEAPALDVGPFMAIYRSLTGPAVYEDRGVIVFGMAAACSRPRLP
jgi:hypothetical protein